MRRALSEDERSQSLGDIADIHSAYKPDAPAISDESRSVTWSELATRVHQIASALAAGKSGIERLDPIAGRILRPHMALVHAENIFVVAGAL